MRLAFACRGLRRHQADPPARRGHHWTRKNAIAASANSVGMITQARPSAARSWTLAGGELSALTCVSPRRQARHGAT